MQNRNRSFQADRTGSYQGFGRPQQGRFNRSNHDTSYSQQYGQDQQAQRQNFGGGYQSYSNDDQGRQNQSQSWQQHEVAPYTFGGSMGYGEGSGYGTSATGFGSERYRQGSDFSERQGYHPSRSMNEGVYKPDSYSSSGMPQSSEQIGSRFYGDQTGQQYGGTRSTYGSGASFGGQNYGQQYGSQYDRQSYGPQQYGSQSYGSQNYGSQDSQQYGSQGYGSQYGNTYGEHAGKGPKGYRRSEERIREDVCEALEHHGGVDASEIDVQVSEGVVTLTGTVESRQMKRLAEEAVEHLSGVQDIKNELKVEDSSSSSYAKRSAFSDSASTEGSRSLSGASSTSSNKTSSTGRSSSSMTKQ